MADRHAALGAGGKVAERHAALGAGGKVASAAGAGGKYLPITLSCTSQLLVPALILLSATLQSV